MAINGKNLSNFVFSFHPLEVPESPLVRCKDSQRIFSSNPQKAFYSLKNCINDKQQKPPDKETDEEKYARELEMEMLKEMQEDSDLEDTMEDNSNKMQELFTSSELMATNRSLAYNEEDYDYENELSNLSNGFKTLLSYKDPETKEPLKVPGTLEPKDETDLSAPNVINLNYDDDLNLFYDHFSSKYYVMNN